MSWQARVRERLCRDEWASLRELFEEVENDIPLHVAYRANSRNWGGADAGITAVRWRTFKLYLYSLKVITDPPMRHKRSRQHYDYVTTRVSLPAATNAVCGRCAGILVMCGQLLYCRRCRHSISPRPGQRLAEANRLFWQQMRDRDEAPLRRRR